MINQTALLSQQGYLLKSNDHSASTIINQQLKPNRTTKAPLPSQGFESEVTKNKEKEKKNTKKWLTRLFNHSNHPWFFFEQADKNISTERERRLYLPSSPPS